MRERVDMSRVFVVGEMQQMAHFVYQDYSMRLDALRQQNEQVGQLHWKVKLSCYTLYHDCENF